MIKRNSSQIHVRNLIHFRENSNCAIFRVWTRLILYILISFNGLYSTYKICSVDTHLTFHFSNVDWSCQETQGSDTMKTCVSVLKRTRVSDW